MMVLGARGSYFYGFLIFILLTAFAGRSNASIGDRLPDFKECVKVLLCTRWLVFVLANEATNRSVKRKIVSMETQ